MALMQNVARYVIKDDHPWIVMACGHSKPLPRGIYDENTKRLCRECSAALGPLSLREAEIVLLIAEGHRAESVANQLDMRYETVRRHMGNIFSKLHVNSTLEVVTWYYKNYWRPKDNA